MTNSPPARDPLVAFLYEIMRDHVPPADVQGVIERGLGDEEGPSRGYLTDRALAQKAELFARVLKAPGRPPRDTWSAVQLILAAGATFMLVASSAVFAYTMFKHS